MQLMLQSIPLTETLRYALGAKAPDPLPDALAASAKEACQALLPVCQPRYTYLVRPTQPLLEGLLSGEDIRRHLQGCERCVLFGATLGPQADALIRQGFRKFIPETTKIIIAQRVASVQDADRIILMNNGEIDAIGSHEELMATNQVYREIYTSQNRTNSQGKAGAENG